MEQEIKVTKRKLAYPTQRERLLAYLYKNKGKRSSDWDIVMEVRTLQYSARIRELRKLGYIIENMSKWGTNSLGEKVRYGYFRLVKDPLGARIN